MNFKEIPLSQETLEQLVIAIINLRTANNLVINLRPEHVLQNWILNQVPSPGFQPLRNCNL